MLSYSRKRAAPMFGSGANSYSSCIAVNVSSALRDGLAQSENVVLKWALIFAVIATVAGLLGFTGIAAGAVGIAKILFIVFLVLFVLVVLLALLGIGAAR